MRTKVGEYYEVKNTEGMYGLAHQFCTLNAAKMMAEVSNKEAIAKGFKAEEYIITKTTWARQYDDEGRFMFEDVHTSRVYPQ